MAFFYFFLKNNSCFLFSFLPKPVALPPSFIILNGRPPKAPTKNLGTPAPTGTLARGVGGAAAMASSPHPCRLFPGIFCSPLQFRTHKLSSRIITIRNHTGMSPAAVAGPLSVPAPARSFKPSVTSRTPLTVQFRLTILLSVSDSRSFGARAEGVCWLASPEEAAALGDAAG